MHLKKRAKHNSPAISNKNVVINFSLKFVQILFIRKAFLINNCAVVYLVAANQYLHMLLQYL